MKVNRGRLEFNYHRSGRFFIGEQNRLEEKIEMMYYVALSNYINANVLMAQLISTY